jgi:hypothetical protein
MITKQQKKAFKKIFGKFYTPNVIKVLQKKGVLDAKGKTHSASMISNIFNGLASHELIEEAIIEAVIIQKAENRKKEIKKKKLLKSIL